MSIRWLVRLLAGAVLAAAAAVSAQTTSVPPGSAAKTLVTHRPQVDGRELLMQVVEVAYQPGGWSAAHRHTCPVVVYVLEGAVRMQAGGQPERVYAAGETFVETPADVHAVSANASATAPARFLAFFTCDGDVPQTGPVPEKPGAQGGFR